MVSVDFFKPTPPIAFARVESYFLGHSAFTAVPHHFGFQIFTIFIAAV
jgi:hypothetical protein